MTRTRIIIVEDMEIVRKGLRALLVSYPGIDVCGEAGDGIEAIEKARKLEPDVILMDLTMPRMDGPPAITEIKKNQPDITILALTVHKEDQMLFQALSAGADGYVLKDASEDELIRAINMVHRGGKYISPEISNLMIDGYLSSKNEIATGIDGLTKREIEVLTLLAGGCAYKEIADRLYISPKTVDAHITKTKKKLNLRSTAELIVAATRAGLVRTTKPA